MAEVTFQRVPTYQEQLTSRVPNSRRKQQPQQQRQLLSCTKCRERKVKCDRTKPCSACCARGSPRDCHFIAEDGNYTPIQQSYELRKLRAENLQLKERFRALKIPIDEGESDEAGSPESQVGGKLSPAQKRRFTKQKRFQSSDWQDSIYFGSPGLATVISDFASVNMDDYATLSHTMPRPMELFAPRSSPAYTFATLFSASPDECIPQLLSCLPGKPELLAYMDTFEQRVSVQIPAQLSRNEVERFLADVKSNSQSCPAMLALLLAVIALGAQHAIWDKNGEPDAMKMETEAQKGHVYITAAMQALRLASFLHRPSLIAIQALILLGKYLTNSGRFLDAFTLFGITIRSAHSIGLHCHPKYLDPSPPTQMSVVLRQKIWWYMLRLDEEYSMTFGRPLGISGIGTCCWPQELTTDPIVLRFGDFMMQFTVLARQILSSDRLTDLRIDEFTDSLRGLLDTLPETLQFHASWDYSNDALPHDTWSLRFMAAVYHCKTHTYLILLNRQRTQNATLFDPHISASAMPSFRPVNRTSSKQSSPTPPTRSSIRGRARVIASSEEIVLAFFFFYRRQPSALIDWSLGQQAFNSCMLLLLDAIECQEITAGAMQVERAFAIFKELDENKVHKLARYAIEKLSWGLQRLHNIVTPSPYGIQVHGQQEDCTFMQGVKQNEATRAAGAMENVMGHTGMQLLEDCGLQGSVRESFAPMTWGTLGLPTESPRDRGNRPHDARAKEKNGLDSRAYAEETKNLQSADVAQDLSRSSTRCSAPTRYATSDDDCMQPHGYTAPTSPTDFSRLDNRHLNASTKDYQGWQDGCSREGDRPLHSSAQWQGTAATHSAVTSGRKGREHEAFPSAYGKEDRHAKSSVAAMNPPYVAPVSQRHNSCPVLPHMVTASPPPRPTQSSTNHVDRPAATQRSHRTSPDVPLIAPSRGSKTSTSHPFCQANPQRPNHMGNIFGSAASIGGHAAHPLMSSIAEAPLGFPATTHLMYPRQQDQFSFHHPTHPTHHSSTTAHSLLTPLAESMNMNDWARYDGGRS